LEVCCLAWVPSCIMSAISSTLTLLLHLSPLCYGNHKPQEITSAGFKLFFCNFLNNVSFHRIEELELLQCASFWLKGMLWLVWVSIPHYYIFLHISNKAFSLS
jgi:hypothetical protein